jgi:DNA end-binding protein Ku
MRSVWNGFVRLAVFSIPVKLYAATSEAKSGFNQVHDKCKARLSQKLVCTACGEEVAHADAAKGHEHNGQYVVVTKQELDQIKVEADSMIDIKQLVPIENVPATLFAEPYYMAPTGKKTHGSFAVLREALAGKVAFATVAMRNREYPIAIRGCGRGILVSKLWTQEEVRSMDEIKDLNVPEVLNADPRLVELARQVVEGMTQDSMAGVSLKNTHAERVQQLIESKIAGTPAAAAISTAPSSPTVDVLEALKASLAQVATKPVAGKKKQAKIVEIPQQKRRKAS